MTPGVYLRGLVGAVWLFSGAVAAAQTATTVAGVFEEAAAECASVDAGIFAPGDAAGDTAVTEVDLTGDGSPEQIIDLAGFTCSTLASFYGGTGGAPIVVLAGGRRFDWTVLGHRVIPWDGLPPVLLMSVHGGLCGGTGSDPCVQAAVWNGAAFMTIGGIAE